MEGLSSINKMLLSNELLNSNVKASKNIPSSWVRIKSIFSETVSLSSLNLSEQQQTEAMHILDQLKTIEEGVKSLRKEVKNEKNPQKKEELSKKLGELENEWALASYSLKKTETAFKDRLLGNCKFVRVLQQRERRIANLMHKTLFENRLSATQKLEQIDDQLRSIVLDENLYLSGMIDEPKGERSIDKRVTECFGALKEASLTDNIAVQAGVRQRLEPLYWIVQRHLPPEKEGTEGVDAQNKKEDVDIKQVAENINKLYGQLSENLDNKVDIKIEDDKISREFSIFLDNFKLLYKDKKLEFDFFNEFIQQTKKDKGFVHEVETEEGYIIPKQFEIDMPRQYCAVGGRLVLFPGSFNSKDSENKYEVVDEEEFNQELKNEFIQKIDLFCDNRLNFENKTYQKKDVINAALLMTNQSLNGVIFTLQDPPNEKKLLLAKPSKQETSEVGSLEKVDENFYRELAKRGEASYEIIEENGEPYLVLNQPLSYEYEKQNGDVLFKPMAILKAKIPLPHGQAEITYDWSIASG